jgi:deoxyribodipyrimidine photo-lyase
LPRHRGYAGLCFIITLRAVWTALVWPEGGAEITQVEYDRLDDGIARREGERFPLTRASALERLSEFLPASGSEYSRKRNLDLGPGQHRHVSRLSAALRRRLLSEDEIVCAVLGRHDPDAAAKFVSEVYWRSYWKGWLEQRPGLWQGYRVAVSRAECALDEDGDLRQRYDQACSAKSGIDCFDWWVTELEATGYLHNWARMQFASIWIFTLGLPWELGAAFTLSRFIDADPASNTLSWRWVAGLHTQGKAYLADPDRICAMTGGRFAPRGLARRANIPSETLIVPQAGPWRGTRSPCSDLSSLLVLSVEDLSLETLPEISRLPVLALGVLAPESAADRVALDDAVARATRTWPSAHWVGPITPSGLLQAKDLGCRQIVTGFTCVGPTADRLASLARTAEQNDLPVTEQMRDWDTVVWPYCRKGFFSLKERIPALIERYRLARPQARLV